MLRYKVYGRPSGSVEVLLVGLQVTFLWFGGKSIGCMVRSEVVTDGVTSEVSLVQG